eukprot:1326626-Rhodomonas_salina.3
MEKKTMSATAAVSASTMALLGMEGRYQEDGARKDGEQDEDGPRRRVQQPSHIPPDIPPYLALVPATFYICTTQHSSIAHLSTHSSTAHDSTKYSIAA